MDFNFLAALFFVLWVLFGLAVLFVVVCITDDIEYKFGHGWAMTFFLFSVLVPLAVVVGFTSP